MIGKATHKEIGDPAEVLMVRVPWESCGEMSMQCDCVKPRLEEVVVSQHRPSESVV